MKLERKKHGEASMFSEEGFDSMKKSVLNNNPSLAKNPVETRQKMSGLIEDIEKNLAEQEGGWETAVNILLQGLNLLARLIGELEFSIPGLESLGKEKAVDPIRDKKVAIYFNAPPVAVRALVKILSSNGEVGGNYNFFSSPSLLLAEIIQGKVCGVIGVHPTSDSTDIEALLRHDLKNLSGWDYVKARDYILPPCANFGMPWSIADLVTTMARMQKGELEPAAEENFSLAENMRILKTHMIWQEEPVYVTIVDDIAAEVEGMAMILTHWPGLSVSLIINNISQGNVSQMVLPETSIVLLDEDLGLGIKGTQIAANLREAGYKGIIASTTGGAKPAWAKLHFQKKMRVAKSFAAAREFVSFMNSLLR